MALQSYAALVEAQALSSGVVFLTLLTFDHATLPAPLRFVSPGSSGVVSRGNPYVAFPFDIVLPPERFGEVPVATLTIGNITGEVFAALQALRPSPSITIEIVTEDDLDTVQYANADFEIGSLTVDGVSSLSMELAVARIFSLPFPGINMDRANVPGIFSDL